MSAAYALRKIAITALFGAFVMLTASVFFIPQKAAAATCSAAATPTIENDAASGTNRIVWVDGGVECEPTAAQQQAAQPNPNANFTDARDKALGIQRSACSIWSGSWSFDNCIWKPLMSGIGSLFLSLGAVILGVAGSIFDTLISYIVIAFGKTIRDLNILEAINTGWTVFRDFSNILIIGFFVFIAISIILGLSEFGQKRLIANVLVVAVLMNFSLLFTKLIIDGSNFVAYQIYAQMASASGANATQFRVADGFLAPMKIGSVWDTKGLLDKVATKTDSGFQALAFGMVGGIMLIAVAMVLFYGSFLIAWRGVLFIFLMLTAPLAFASYLVPTLAKSEYGWNSWWKMLINNAAFGPLLMIMLALSLAIVQAAGTRSSSSFGEIIANPTSLGASAWVTILVYIIGIGLLFISMKLASNFATSIGGGYNFVTGLSKLIGLSPLAGIAGIAGSQLRNRIGGRAAFKSLELENQIEKQREAVRKAPEHLQFQENQKLMNLLKQKGAADKTAKREFNFENTALGNVLRKVGMPAVPGEAKGGFEGPRKKVAEESAKSIESAVVSKDQAETIAKSIVSGQQEESKKALEAQKASNEQIVKAAESMADSAKRNLGLHEEHNKALEQRAASTQIQAQAQSEHKAGKISDSKREEIMREEDEKIKQANKTITETRQRMKEIETAHTELPHVQEAKNQMAAADTGLRNLEKEHERTVKQVSARLIEQSVDDAANIASSLHHLDAYETKVTGKQIRAKLKNKRLVDQARAIQEEIGPETRPAEGGTV